MAFYNDAPKKNRKVNHADQGSWDDEGAHYSRKPQGTVARFGPRSGETVEGSRQSGRPDFRDGKAFRSGTRNGTGEHTRARNAMADRDARPYQSREGRPSQGRPAQGRPAQGRPDRPFQSRDVRPVQGRDERPAQGRPAQGERRGAPRRPMTAPSMPVQNDQPAYRRFEQKAPVRAVPVAMAAPVVSTEECIPNENLLSGRNPIREALKAGRDIEKLLVQKGDLSGSAREIVKMAKEAHVPVQEVEKTRLDEITPHHQGLLAFASAYHYATVEDMLAVAAERNEAPFLILLDGVTDPHNLGAVIRSAECVGAHGVIVPERRSVGLTPAAVKASAGAVEHVKVARVTNLTRTLEDLQKQNIWAYAVTMNGTDYQKTDFSGGVALVIGAEGEGISRLTLEKCDHKVSLPMMGHIDSLNASVAAGVMMYRVLESRRKA